MTGPQDAMSGQGMGATVVRWGEMSVRRETDPDSGMVSWTAWSDVVDVDALAYRARMLGGLLAMADVEACVMTVAARVAISPSSGATEDWVRQELGRQIGAEIAICWGRSGEAWDDGRRGPPHEDVAGDARRGTGPSR